VGEIYGRANRVADALNMEVYCDRGVLNGVISFARGFITIEVPSRQNNSSCK
jgi:hypothetical protein